MGYGIQKGYQLRIFPTNRSPEASNKRIDRRKCFPQQALAQPLCFTCSLNDHINDIDNTSQKHNSTITMSLCHPNRTKNYFSSVHCQNLQWSWRENMENRTIFKIIDLMDLILSAAWVRFLKDKHNMIFPFVLYWSSGDKVINYENVLLTECESWMTGLDKKTWKGYICNAVLLTDLKPCLAACYIILILMRTYDDA